MIKFVFVLLYLLVFSIISLPLYLYTYIIDRKNPLKAATVSQKIVSRGFKILFFVLGIKLECKGIENVPNDRPVLFVGNHRSYADIVASYVTLPVTTGFVAKKEMAKAPCISRWLVKMKGVFLDRQNPKEGLKAILTAIDNVKNGISMFIMPEGTRNQGDEMLPFKKGSLKIAEKTECPIVPVAFTNTDDVFERHYPRVKAAHVMIEYGKPIYMDQLSKEEKKTITEDVQSVIKEMLDKNNK